MTRPPPPAVLAAFGLTGEPVRLAGGRGEAFRVGNAVTKPVLDAEEATWCAASLDGLPVDGFRLARPRPAGDGRWVVDGWAAWAHVAGEPAAGRWDEVLDVGRKLSAALARLEPPGLLRRRRHRWAVADRAAWGEERADVPPTMVPLVDRLSASLRPVDLPTQVIHADLAGNVLFADGHDPAVIDVSPFVRPAGFALAVVVVDALAWGGADVTLVDALDDEPEAAQLLRRAVLFRLFAAADVEAERRAHEPVVDLLQSRP